MYFLLLLHAMQKSNPITVNAQYVKDLSFENPRAPFVFSQQEQPEINLNLEIVVNIVEQNMYEVSLKINVEASIKEEKIFLVELEYAGLFTLDEADLEKEQKELILSVHCPSIIFPYARRIISDVTKDGGYPPLLISPIDFLGLYMQRKDKEGDAEDKLVN